MGPGGEPEPASLLILDGETVEGYGPLLRACGHRITTPRSTREAHQLMLRDPPSLLILGDEVLGEGAELRTIARTLGIPVLVVLDRGDELAMRTKHVATDGDWMVRGAPPEELAARVAGLLRRGSEGPGMNAGGRRPVVPIDGRFTALVHEHLVDIPACELLLIAGDVSFARKGD